MGTEGNRPVPKLSDDQQSALRRWRAFWKSRSKEENLKTLSDMVFGRPLRDERDEGARELAAVVLEALAKEPD